MDKEKEPEKESEDATLFDPNKLKEDEDVCYKKSDTFCKKYNIIN